MKDNNLELEVMQAISEKDVIQLRDKLDKIMNQPFKLYFDKTIIKAVKEAFEDMPRRFYGKDLIKRYWNYHKHNKGLIMHDTILRCFRYLRQTDVLKCKCLNRTQSFYEKG